MDQNEWLHSQARHQLVPLPQFRSCRFSGKPSQATRLVALKPARTFTCRRGTGNGGKRGGRDVELDSYDMINIGAIQRVQR